MAPQVVAAERPLGQREGDADGRAAGTTLQPDRPAVRLDDGVDQREAEPDTARAVAGVAPTGEPLEGVVADRSERILPMTQLRATSRVVLRNCLTAPLWRLTRPEAYRCGCVPGIREQSVSSCISSSPNAASAPSRSTTRRLFRRNSTGTTGKASVPSTTSSTLLWRAEQRRTTRAAAAASKNKTAKAT